MPGTIPPFLDPTPWIPLARGASVADVRRALGASQPGEEEFAALLSASADTLLEDMAVRARELTRHHFGRTLSLYIPLYLSDYCSGGCVYCGFAADRPQQRSRLAPDAIVRELEAIKAMGFDEVLLLTGERTPYADLEFLRQAVQSAAQRFAAVTIEAFPMQAEEYRVLSREGAIGVTVYQETYEPVQYEHMHRWGPKRDYANRLETPVRVLEGGMRTIGLGALLGLSDPFYDTISLFRHAMHVRRRFWQSGVSISFPRVCAQEGGYTPPYTVDDRMLARIIFAFRICMPDVPLVLSTREAPGFRDGMAGVGINKMSIASRTTVGGYQTPVESPDGQFHVNDDRDIETFCAMLKGKGLEPVFKNWDKVYRE
jgi:2-iminoacetate synthase